MSEVQVRLCRSHTDYEGGIMDYDTIAAALSHLKLHVLEEFDAEYNSYSALCLETGTIATADSADDLINAIKDALGCEIALAIRAGDLERLFASPAAPSARVRWLRAAGLNSEVTTVPLDITPLIHMPSSPQRRGVQSELAIAKTLKRTVA
jgi:hypothetical protein